MNQFSQKILKHNHCIYNKGSYLCQSLHMSTICIEGPFKPGQFDHLSDTFGQKPGNWRSLTSSHHVGRVARHSSLERIGVKEPSYSSYDSNTNNTTTQRPNHR